MEPRQVMLKSVSTLQTHEIITYRERSCHILYVIFSHQEKKTESFTAALPK